jgi:hypothetical protein
VAKHIVEELERNPDMVLLEEEPQKQVEDNWLYPAQSKK